MRVFVKNLRNKPLMPTSSRNARMLLKSGKAKVVKRCPFTIQLTKQSGESKQELILGVDTGSKFVGLSVVTKKEEIYSGELQLRTDIVDLLSTRKSLRRSRRNRKTRYRKARFINRVKSKNKGWLSPSIEHKINSHLRIIKKLHDIMPITKIIAEVASFNIQKIKNSEISGYGYQNGEQLNFYNVREYVLFRDGHKCNGRAGCKNKILEVHHIESRKTGGNAPNNLITLCRDCHKDCHSEKLKLKLKRGNSFRDAAFMVIMRKTLLLRLKSLYDNVVETYGYVTKYVRTIHGISKSHRLDALCITEIPEVIRCNTWFRMKCVRRHNRQIHKLTINKGGTRKLNQSPYLVKGFRLFDKVLYENKEYFVFGRRLNGWFDIRDLSGNKVNNGSVNIRHIHLISKRSSILNERVSFLHQC